MVISKLTVKDLAIGLLAVDRLTRLITEDTITEPMRAAISKRWPNSKLEEGVNCRACMSVWSGLLVCSGLVPRWVLSALAASAAVLMIDRQDERVGLLVSAYRKRADRAAVAQGQA